MNVVQQLPQPQNLNIMGLSIFPDIMNPSKVATEGLTFDKIVSKNSIPIYQYDLEGNFIKEWKSATEAAKFYNAKGSGNFCKAVKKGIKLYNSYWKNNGNC